MKKILNCITIGDEKGIGLELIYKIWKNHKKNTKTFFLIGNYSNIKRKLKKYNNSIKLFKINNPSEAKRYFNKYLPVINLNSNLNEKITLDALNIAYKYVKEKLITGIITLPINKNKIISINKNFIDQTDYFGRLDKKESSMILYSNKIIVFPLTTHIPINKIGKYINKSYVRKKIKKLFVSLNKDFNLNNFKIGISGLNPHAGENGKIGVEEKKILTPIIKEFKKKGFMIKGPISPDAIFLNKNLKKFDCIITMYHDQALIPFKILNYDDGVNFTSGLSFIRTSPCHGTAYDIVGKNIGNEKSLLNAIKLANLINKNRNNA